MLHQTSRRIDTPRILYYYYRLFFLVDNNDTGTCSVYENKNPFEQCVTQKNNNNNIYRHTVVVVLEP